MNQKISNNMFLKRDQKKQYTLTPEDKSLLNKYIWVEKLLRNPKDFNIKNSNIENVVTKINVEIDD